MKSVRSHASEGRQESAASDPNGRPPGRAWQGSGAVRLLHGPTALALVTRGQIAALTARALHSAQFVGDLPRDQLREYRSLAALSARACNEASASANRFLALAFEGAEPVGYVIAARHGCDDHEIDWLMVDPSRHGCGVADMLMLAGMRWLGLQHPIWLTVVRQNWRAIRFYRRFGFATDHHVRPSHAVPRIVMRRLPMERPIS